MEEAAGRLTTTFKGLQMSVDYAVEKLRIAVGCLAENGGSVQSRLEAAGISIHSIRPEDDLPRDLGKRFNLLMKNLTRVEAEGSEGTLAATTRSLSDEEARKYAQEILSLFENAVRKAEREHPTED